MKYSHKIAKQSDKSEDLAETLDRDAVGTVVGPPKGLEVGDFSMDRVVC